MTGPSIYHCDGSWKVHTQTILVALILQLFACIGHLQHGNIVGVSHSRTNTQMENRHFTMSGYGRKTTSGRGVHRSSATNDSEAVGLEKSRGCGKVPVADAVTLLQDFDPGENRESESD